ncbi:MAG TPA: hypothetical protein VGR06_41395 [Actinophytocola sp.]|jgi:hypothetical protein|uniref:hypothetical protein n=1 Tax=Actinophytocola sp. TaxID=1872138 RepID=UPI002E0B60E1|nr:hypothetical protein [Actinophytocola sp.]
MSKKRETGFTLQVITSGLAAITAALLGSTLGVAGTVLGAGVASVVTTIAAAAYARSIQHTRARVRLAQAKVIGRANESQPDGDTESSENEGQPRRLSRPALIVATGLAFALGMLAITGFEWISGHPVSGGQGTTIGGIIRPQRGPTPVERPSPASTTTSVPSTVTSTTPSPPATDPTTSTTPPTSVPSTEPPVTTTTPTGSPSASVPPH